METKQSMPLGKITKLTTTQRDLGLTKQPKYEVQKKNINGEETEK